MDKNILYRQDNKELYDKLLSIAVYQRINRVSFERYIVYKGDVYFYDDFSKNFQYIKYNGNQRRKSQLFRLLRDERHKL